VQIEEWLKSFEGQTGHSTEGGMVKLKLETGHATLQPLFNLHLECPVCPAGKGIEGQTGHSTEGGMVKLKLETGHAISGFP